MWFDWVDTDSLEIWANMVIRTIGGWGTNEYTTVSTLEQFANAVSSTGPAVVIVEGAISGEGKVTVGSYKSILGAPGSCKFAPKTQVTTAMKA
jgi:pectate lyase